MSKPLDVFEKHRQHRRDVHRRIAQMKKEWYERKETRSSYVPRFNSYGYSDRQRGWWLFIIFLVPMFLAECSK